MRDWLETQRWYWVSITIRITVFPWHWQFRCSYNPEFSWYVDAGPLNVAVIW